MGNITSTITSKWQVTIPEAVRKEVPLKIGERISWKVNGDELIGQRIRSISELAGCLKSESIPALGKSLKGAFANASIARHNRISRQKK